jgi:methyltransferase (TIGR00027 family)
MTLIRNVAGTAFVVAEFRAEENLKEKPLYSDPVVQAFLDAESKRAADRIFASFPPIKTNVWIRTRYLDDRLDAQLQNDFRQVVILGAGLDTRAQRKAKPGVDYFEIDDGATLAFKRERLREKGIEPGVAYIPGDYVADGLVELLSRNGFDFSAPTHFLWEGNTMYLSRPAVSRVLDSIAKNLRRFSISFDYLAPEVIANETGDPEITAVVERFAAMGAPWTYGISEVNSLAQSIDARIADRFTIAELHRLYWPDKTPDSRLFEYYALCTLEAPGSAAPNP